MRPMKKTAMLGWLLLAGCSANGSSGGAFTPGTADGLLADDRETTPLPHVLANHCAAVVGDRVVGAGGNWTPADAFVSVDEVWAATAGDDGELGAWDLVASLPSAASGVTCVADGSRLIVLGGLWENAAHQSKVWAAEPGE